MSHQHLRRYSYDDSSHAMPCYAKNRIHGRCRRKSIFLRATWCRKLGYWRPMTTLLQGVLGPWISRVGVGLAFGWLQGGHAM